MPGFDSLICPRCMTEGATVTLNLSDLDTLACQDCEEEYTLTDVRNLIDSWGPVFRLLDSLHAQQTP